MSKELKTFVADSIATLRESGMSIPSGEELELWLQNEIKTRGPVIVSIMKNAIRKGVA